MEGCIRLCEAVLEQAGRDYRTWYRALLESPGNKTAKQEVDALERFIRSPRFKLFGMGELDPEATIRELRKRAEASCANEQKRPAAARMTRQRRARKETTE